MDRTETVRHLTHAKGWWIEGLQIIHSQVNEYLEASDVNARLPEFSVNGCPGLDVARRQLNAHLISAQTNGAVLEFEAEFEQSPWRLVLQNLTQQGPVSRNWIDGNNRLSDGRISNSADLDWMVTKVLPHMRLPEQWWPSLVVEPTNWCMVEMIAYFDQLTHAACFSFQNANDWQPEGRRGVSSPPSTANAVQYSVDIRSLRDWAPLYGLGKKDKSSRELKRRIDRGVIRAKRLTQRRWQIALEDLPAGHPERLLA